MTTDNEYTIQSKNIPTDIDGAGQDCYLPARKVRERYGVTSMTLSRWLSDERTEFPKPTYFGRSRYRRLSDLLAWELKSAKGRWDECKGPPRTIDAYGIECTSRYGLQPEPNKMKGPAKILVIFDMPVTEIFSDSKIGAQYGIQISVRDAGLASTIAHSMGGWAVQFHGGHNGVVVKFGDDVLAMAETDWLPRPWSERGRQR